MDNAPMNCCSQEKTTACCSNKAAMALVGIAHANAPANSEPLTREVSFVSTDVMATPKVDTAQADMNCLERRKRTVSVDFRSTEPCDCCPSTKGPVTKKPKRTFVNELKDLADFLKQERRVLREGETTKIASFYQVKEPDTELVAEWRSSGNDVYATMLQKIRRLEDMETKFGPWASHFRG